MIEDYPDGVNYAIRNVTRDINILNRIVCVLFAMNREFVLTGASETPNDVVIFAPNYVTAATEKRHVMLNT